MDNQPIASTVSDQPIVATPPKMTISELKIKRAVNGFTLGVSYKENDLQYDRYVCATKEEVIKFISDNL